MINPAHKLALCNAAREIPEHIHVSMALSPVDISDAEGEGSFSWAMILPAGEKISARDGRVYQNPNPQVLVDDYNADPVDIMIDLNHDSVGRGSDPAAHGWVKGMELRGGAIWAHIEWTDIGADVLARKHFRYLSPAFLADTENTIKAFLSVGLVNQPAMTMIAVARSEAAAGAHPSTKIKPKIKESIVDENQIAQLRKAYGLADDASIEDVIAASLAAAPAPADTSNPSAAPSASPAAAAPQGQVSGTETGAQSPASAGANSAPDLTEFVPRADYDTMASRLAEFEAGASAASETAPAPAEIEAALDAAIATARIAPISRAYHLEMCSTQKGFDAFKTFIKSAPKVVATSADKSLDAPVTAGLQLSSVEISVCRALGISQDKLIARKKAKGA